LASRVISIGRSARGIVFTGLPWMLLGYAVYRVPSLTQLASRVGVLSASGALVLCNHALAQI